jgi:retinol-binding protein 3
MKTTYVRGIFISLVLNISMNPAFSQTEEVAPDFTEKKLVIDKVSEWLREYYVFPDVAEQCIKKMNEQLTAGAYDKEVKRPVDFIRLLNPDLLEVSHDKHLKVVALFGIEEQTEEVISIEEKVNYNHFLKRGNYGFMNLGWKKDNIGYLEFRAFCSPDVAGDKVRSAMSYLSDMDALVIDLRSLIMGGKPEMVSLISSYFFNQPTILNRIYFRQENITEENWTFPVKGKRFPYDIPLYILVNENVFSAGEEFSYSMQALKRATIIGEKTGGGAHITRPFRINNRYEALIPWGRAINPVTGTNWEGTGVIPDIEVRPDSALEVALGLASAEALKRREFRETKDQEKTLELNGKLNQVKTLFQSNQAKDAASLLWQVLTDGINSRLVSEEMIDDLGTYWMEKEMIDMALVCFRFNIQQYPESVTSAVHYYNQAEALIKKGLKNEARISLQKALEINPHAAWAKRLSDSIRL